MLTMGILQIQVEDSDKSQAEDSYTSYRVNRRHYKVFSNSIMLPLKTYIYITKLLGSELYSLT